MEYQCSNCGDNIKVLNLNIYHIHCEECGKEYQICKHYSYKNGGPCRALGKKSAKFCQACGQRPKRSTSVTKMWLETGENETETEATEGEETTLETSSRNSSPEPTTPEESSESKMDWNEAKVAELLGCSSNQLEYETSSGVSIYKMPFEETGSDPKYGLRRCAIAPPEFLQRPPRIRATGDKVIMIVGATGTGKSTLVNAIANYIVRVDWKDGFRIKLITEQDEGGGQLRTQAHSQTTRITAYTFYHQQEYAIDYNLTVIDTPGFGDTKGLDQDKKITENIRQFFSSKEFEGIDQVHAICFVIQASESRLTPSQRYVLDSILLLFGKDIAENIDLFLTFADSGIPPVLSAVTEAQITYRNSYKFNNSALYSKSRKTENDQNNVSDDIEYLSKRMCWKMGTDSLKMFFTDLAKREPKSLSLTIEVLKERQQLEICIQGLEQQIHMVLCKMEVLRQHQLHLKDNEKKINTNNKYKYEVKEYQSKRVDLPKGKSATNCKTCKCTCLYPCDNSNDGAKHGCTAMNKDGQHSTCTVCPGHCIWSEHVNDSYRYEIEEVKVTKYFNAVRNEYPKAPKNGLPVQQVVAKMEEEIKQLKQKIDDLIIQAQKSINRLNEIALKPNSMTVAEYIELLVQSEEREKKSGYKERIKELEEAKQRTSPNQRGHGYIVN